MFVPAPPRASSLFRTLAYPGCFSSKSLQRRPGDWDLWGPFFFLGLTLSWSASANKSEVFVVAFALLATGDVILTLNVLLLLSTPVGRRLHSTLFFTRCKNRLVKNMAECKRMYIFVGFLIIVINRSSLPLEFSKELS
ncbi:hypothetical protein GQ457_01G024650 [Hibiscus cannabinus]